MASEYKSPFSIGKRQTIYIDPNDPRVRGFKYGITASRIGAEIEILGSNGLNQSGIFSHLKNSSSGSAIVIKPPEKSEVKPGTPTNLSAEWQDLATGATLVITFDFDFSEETNKNVVEFQYDLTDIGENFTTNLLVSKIINTSSQSQIIYFTESMNIDNFGEFLPDFSKLRVCAVDNFSQAGEFAELTNIPEYQNDLPTPVITVTSILQGYSVDWQTVSQTFEFVTIEEVVSDASTNPGTGYDQVYLGVSSIKPARITTATTEARWVRARFNNKGTLFSQYSNAVKVIPTNPISADLVPPAEVTAVSGAWSGDNIVISYTLPATDAGSRFQVGLTAPNSSVGYFYAFPSGSSLNQTYTITKADLFAQFGSHYSSYTGILKSIDAADNRTSGVAFSVSQRPNPLLGITPTFTTTALVNGYSISYTLPAGAVYAEVYQKYTTWSGVTPIDSFTGSYSSGGASGTNTVTLSSVLDNDGGSVTTIPTGYIVIGTGIPENTYITSVSGNQITVNNNFTSQVSGSVTGYGIVYSGTSPANISSTIYQNTYLLVRFYDDFENASNYSAEQIVVPLSPVTVDITGPGNVSSVGISTSSGIDTTGTLGFNGYIDLSWAAVTESSMRGYRIRFTTDTVDEVYSYVDYPIDQTNIPSGTLSYRLGGLAVGAEYYIGIATYDQYNNLSTSFTEFDPVTISGTPAITDYITAGNFQFGQGVDPLNATGISGTKRGLFFDDSNYWFLNASDSARLKVGGSTSNYLLWNGSSFTIDGNITARGGSFSGNIALTTSGASIYSGDVTTSPGNLTGDGFIFNKDGLLIRKGSNQVSLDTTNGAITANNGNIADWVISSSKIEKLDATSTKYAGLSSTGFYKFWSGSTSAGGDTTQFAVDRTGKLYASSAQISGGTLDVGPSSPNGFHVNTSGQLTASSVNLSGQIKATSGEISGNFIVKPNGSIIAGAGNVNNADSVVIQGATNTEYGGLAAFNSSGAATTEILTKGIQSGSTPRGNTISSPIDINFFTKAAYIGGWIFGPSQMYSSDGQFVIDSASTTNEIRIYGSSSGTNYLLKVGKSDSNTTPYVIWAGPLQSGGSLGTPKFTLSQQGIITAVNADLKGTLSVNDGSMKFGDAVNGSYDGLYVSPNNYWYSTGTFSLGGGVMTGTSSSLTINGANLVLTDTTGGDDGTAGDPTVTRIINPAGIGGVPDGKIVTGRAIWYGGNNTPTSSITSRYAFNNTFGATQGYIGGVARYTSSNPGTFSTGDLYMTIV